MTSLYAEGGGGWLSFGSAPPTPGDAYHKPSAGAVEQVRNRTTGLAPSRCWLRSEPPRVEFSINPVLQWLSGTPLSWAGRGGYAPFAANPPTPFAQL